MNVAGARPALSRAPHRAARPRAELVRRLRREAPDTALVLTSGWDPSEFATYLRSPHGPDAVLHKPFSVQQLGQALTAALRARRPRR
jgi:DNA-binding NarL/FixJ family response regulator